MIITHYWELQREQIIPDQGQVWNVVRGWYIKPTEQQIKEAFDKSQNYKGSTENWRLFKTTSHIEIVARNTN